MRPIIYSGEYCMEKMIRDVDQIHKEIRCIYSKLMPMRRLTAQEQLDFIRPTATECYHCKEPFRSNI